MITKQDSRSQVLLKLMERENVSRHTLVRSNPLTCTAHVPGRTSTAISCATCNGTGYLNGQRADLTNLSILGAPYNTLYYIFGEIQEGHGLRGAGGIGAFTDGDRGIEMLGDAVFYFPTEQRELLTGRVILPQVGNTPRPDRIVRTEDGQVFTVIHTLNQMFGSSPLFKAVALGIGTQGSNHMTIQS